MNSYTELYSEIDSILNNSANIDADNLVINQIMEKLTCCIDGKSILHEQIIKSIREGNMITYLFPGHNYDISKCCNFDYVSKVIKKGLANLLGPRFAVEMSCNSIKIRYLKN